MKTAFYTRNGPADSVLEFGDKPTPEPGAGEVLVKLSTSGVNPSDVKSRAGRPFEFDFIIPHSDGAGTIEAIGEGVTDSSVGDRIWIWNGQWQRQFGTAAEYICVPEFQAVKLGDDIDFQTAACFGIPGLTAAHAVNLLDSNDADTVLITGAASAVGHYITQMVTQAGRKVIGTASREKSKIVLNAGAEACIDYKNENVGERVLELTGGKGVGAIIDMDFSSTLQLISSPALQCGGTILAYGSNDMGELGIPFRDLLFKSISLKFFLVYELNVEERLAAISRLEAFLSSGDADTLISNVFPFDQIIEAHELVESGRAVGNVVLEI